MAEHTVIKSPDTLRADRIPPGQRERKDWPVFRTGDAPATDTANWSLRIRGLVEKERTPTYDEFTSLPRVQVFSDIHCVTTWSRLNNLWEGVADPWQEERYG